MPIKRKDLKIKGSSLWYLVGIITSDGCLSIDGRHIDITSSDYKFLQGIKNLIGIKNKIGIKYNSKKQKAFRIQIANKNFYDFLLTIGLMPRKSLILERIKVPEIYFSDFLRGLIDGDGSIRRWIHPSNKGEQWSLRIYSASLSFSEWLFNKIKEILKANGRVHIERRGYPKEKALYTLKYGKMAAKTILKKCYYPQAVCLQRKNGLARKCITSYKGWKRSKTVFDLEG